MSWRDTAPRLEMNVRCEGTIHQLQWCEGSLHLIDHPDLDAELAMVALGGAEPACVSLHHLWNDAMADGGFLGEWVDETRLTPSWFSWLTMALERMRAEGFHEFLRALPPNRALRMGEFLDRFPPPWLDRAAATVSESVFEGHGVECTLAPPLLSTAVSNRLRRAFVDAVGGRQLAVGAAALVPLRLSIPVGDQRTRTCTAEGLLTGPDRGVALTVQPSWLHRVWGAGASVIGGHLVLALDVLALEVITLEPPSNGDRQATASARLLRWEPVSPGGHRPIVEQRQVRFGSEHWHLAD